MHARPLMETARPAHQLIPQPPIELSNLSRELKIVWLDSTSSEFQVVICDILPDVKHHIEGQIKQQRS